MKTRRNTLRLIKLETICYCNCLPALVQRHAATRLHHAQFFTIGPGVVAFGEGGLRGVFEREHFAEPGLFRTHTQYSAIHIMTAPVNCNHGLDTVAATVLARRGCDH